MASRGSDGTRCAGRNCARPADRAVRVRLRSGRVVRLLELDRSIAEQADALRVEVEEEQADDTDQHPRPQVLRVLDALVVRRPDLGGLRLIVAAGDLRGMAKRLGIRRGAQV